MLSALYYLLLVLLCTLFMILSALALVVCYPFDRGRRTVHELSRILVRIFFFLPPFWRQRVIGRELIDRKKRYVIVINHNTVIDIPALYYIPLNFRWVSKREVFESSLVTTGLPVRPSIFSAVSTVVIRLVIVRLVPSFIRYFIQAFWVSTPPVAAASKVEALYM